MRPPPKSTKMMERAHQWLTTHQNLFTLFGGGATATPPPHRADALGCKSCASARLYPPLAIFRAANPLPTFKKYLFWNSSHLYNRLSCVDVPLNTTQTNKQTITGCSSFIVLHMLQRSSLFGPDRFVTVSTKIASKLLQKVWSFFQPGERFVNDMHIMKFINILYAC